MQVDAHSPVGTGEGEVQRTEMQVQSEGLLLYVSQATYEPGTSPLSTWVPIQFEGIAVLDLFEKYVHGRFPRPRVCILTNLLLQARAEKVTDENFNRKR